MGGLERYNRRSARPKPLTSLPGADRACCTKKSQIPKVSFENRKKSHSKKPSPKILKDMKNEVLLFSSTLYVRYP